jgi:sugar O-acyltransferase (sialic acid O-acetyltransferase NeuD family)
MDSGIIFIGAFHELIELAESNKIKIVGIIDNDMEKEYRGYPILCTDNKAEKLDSKYSKIPLIISPDKPGIREKLSKFYSNLGFSFSSLISDKANISPSASIGNGVVVQSGVNVSSEVKMGHFVKLNTACNVMHDSIIGDYTTIAPNAVILGKVTIGKSCYIGSNAIILPGIEIGDYVIVGAGAVVTKNVEINKTVAGNPAKILR